nr:hypothetical protein [Tanacetum cinerariifolium]
PRRAWHGRRSRAGRWPRGGARSCKPCRAAALRARACGRPAGALAAGSPRGCAAAEQSRRRGCKTASNLRGPRPNR